jgi:hypothetical protein
MKRSAIKYANLIPGLRDYASKYANFYSRVKVIMGADASVAIHPAPGISID